MISNIHYWLRKAKVQDSENTVLPFVYKRRLNGKYITECICINYLWKDTQEAGNPDYLWEGMGGSGWHEERWGEITFENYTMWMY